MAPQETKPAVSKPSFATIAAMAPPNSNGQVNRQRENERPTQASSPIRPKAVVPVESPSAQQLHQELRTSMSRLVVKDTALPPGTLNDQQKSNISRAGLRFDDDCTQVSTSSTKPASLDGKSTTSGTTFALDEKESLRPDDSASVKAGEEDEYGSGPASGAQNSRLGSEAGSRAFRDQFHEITENIGSSPQRMDNLGRRTITEIEEEDPQLTRSPIVTTLPAPVILQPPQLIATNGPPFEYQYQEPDEKLFEALQSPKDRLFLLRLEQEVITFVRDSNEPMIDLPPCNSFCRLLAHKLADYYALTHFVDNAVSSVRLHRTPFCRLPTPLAALAAAPTPIDTVASSQPAMKIMRRAGLGKDGQITMSEGNTAEGSMAPSKAGSEAGYDSQQGTGVVSPTESNMTKDKSAMTREEREANYKLTRERIFGPESENADSTDAVNEVSRCSSRNEKKKKKHKNIDDGFTARSQYNAYYPQMQYATATYEQIPESSAYYGPYAMQANGGMGQYGVMGPINPQGPYPQGMQSMANPQGLLASTNTKPMNNGYDVQHNAAYNQQLPHHYYPQIPQGMIMGQQPSEISSPALSSNGQFPRPQSEMADQQWTSNGYPYPFPQAEQQQYLPPQMQSHMQMTAAQSIPYQYGQLPVQPGMYGAKTQHPVPGSYKSQSFNPQTRAFVPTGDPSSPQLMHSNGPSTNVVSHNPTVSYQTANANFPAYSQQMPVYPQMLSTFSPSPHGFGHESKPFGTRKGSSQSNTAQSPVQSSLSKWGTPSHLPPKPPPPETPTVPEGQHSLPLNNQFNVNTQPMMGGQHLPSFSNGVYSMPGANPQVT